MSFPSWCLLCNMLVFLFFQNCYFIFINMLIYANLFYHVFQTGNHRRSDIIDQSSQSCTLPGCCCNWCKTCHTQQQLQKATQVQISWQREQGEICSAVAGGRRILATGTKPESFSPVFYLPDLSLLYPWKHACKMDDVAQGARVTQSLTGHLRPSSSLWRSWHITNSSLR